MDAFATARVFNLLRGGTRGVREDRDAVRAIDAAWPQARKMLAYYDRFRSSAAESAAIGGTAAVVFGAAGFPFGEQPHAAAARASGPARFFYCDPGSAIAGQRARSLEGDGRALALTGSFRDAIGTRAAVKGSGGGDGPWQVQWGLGAGELEGGEGRLLAASWAELLPSGSQLVIAVPDGGEAGRFAELAGLRAHSPKEAVTWCGKAGLVPVTVADVRAFGRDWVGEGLPSGGGRFVAVVARKL